MTFTQFLSRIMQFAFVFISKVGKFLRGALNLAGVLTAVGLFIVGAMMIYKVQLKDTLVPDISGPVSRFIADIDYETRTVNLDATISKSSDADLEIAIWRFGDGKVQKNEDDNIASSQSISHTFTSAGTYQISYSIIDSNDLSDEAFCTITFSQEVDKTDASKLINSGFLDYNGGTSCGKSYAEYNQYSGIYAINQSKSDTREALMYIGGGVSVLIGLVVFNVTTRLLKKRK